MQTAMLNMLLLQILAMLVVGVSCGYVARRWLRQPGVTGELAAGVVLGPMVLGALAPSIYLILHPQEPAFAAAHAAVIGLSMLFFLFAAGLEIEFEQLRQNYRSWVTTGLLGTIVPFGLGVAAVYAFPQIWQAPPSETPLVFPLVIGTALSISALPVISRVLSDLDLLRHPVGATVMASATLSDLIGWSMLAVILSMSGGGTGNSGIGLHAWQAAVLVAAFAMLMTRFGAPLVHRVFEYAHVMAPNRMVMLYTAMLLASAILAHALGVHPSLGAFLAGVMLASIGQRNGRCAPRAIIEFTYAVFAPIYVVSIGLHADFHGSFDLSLVCLVLVIAIVGKVVGASLGAYLGGMPPRAALAIGFGMNARGAMELVLANVALEYGLIDQRVFIALVIMAVLTSMLSGPMMQWLLAPTRNQIASGGIDAVSVRY